MKFRYVIKDAHGNHFDFEPREQTFRGIKECLEHAEGRLHSAFSGGEVVSVRRLFKGKEKHAPIPQDHQPREVGGYVKCPKCGAKTDTTHLWRCMYCGTQVSAP